MSWRASLIPSAPAAGPTVRSFGGGAGAPPRVVLTGLYNGLATTPYRAWAFRRAEITAFVGSPFRFPHGGRVSFARVRQLDPRLMGQPRLIELGRRTLTSASALLRRLPREARVGLLLCLPERLGLEGGAEGERLSREIARALAADLLALGFSVTPRIHARGHASWAHALLDVAAALSSRSLDLVLTLGIDSYYDPLVLERLFEERRVLDADWLDAILPGEGGALLGWMSKEVTERLQIESSMQLLGIATDREPAHIDNELGLLGQGLSRPAVAMARRLKEEGRRLDWWISDLTPENFRAQEFQLAWPRAAHLAMDPSSTIDFLPTHLGDLGAATMPTAAAIAIEGMRRGDPPAKTCLITGSSLGGDRGVVLLGHDEEREAVVEEEKRTAFFEVDWEAGD